MLVSAEIKVFVAGLGNNQTWKRLLVEEEADYTFIKDLENKVLDLVGKVQSNKSGGITGHIGKFMTPAEFSLISGTTVFNLEAHPGVIDYMLPTECTTQQQHTERKYEHTENYMCS